MTLTPLWHDGGFADAYLGYSDREEVKRRLETATAKARDAWYQTYPAPGTITRLQSSCGDSWQSVQSLRKRSEEDGLYSSRGHFGAAKRWSRVHFWLGLPSAVGAAVAGAAAINDKPALSAVLAMAVTAMTATLTFLNPSDKANTHHSAGTRFNALRNSARRFRQVTLQLEEGTNRLADILADLAKERDALNEGSPQIPRWAFLDARRSIEAGEATHGVDKAKQP